MEINKKVYAPVREQFLVMAEYVRILELRNSPSKIAELQMLIDLVDGLRRQCQIYLSYEMVKENKRGNQKL